MEDSFWKNGPVKGFVHPDPKFSIPDSIKTAAPSEPFAMPEFFRRFCPVRILENLNGTYTYLLDVQTGALKFLEFLAGHFTIDELHGLVEEVRKNRNASSSGEA